MKQRNPPGTSFTAGALAFTGGLGVLLGAVITALCTKVSGKRRDNKAVPA